MDNFVKNIKQKLSTNNLVDMMKEATVIDESSVKEKEVRKVLSNLDPNNELSVEDMASRLDLGKAKPSKSKSQVVVDAAKSSLSVLQKFTSKDNSEEKHAEEDPTHPYVKDDNIFNLYDDFR